MRAHALLLDAAHRLLLIGIAFSDDAEIEYEHFRVLRVFQRPG